MELSLKVTLLKTYLARVLSYLLCQTVLLDASSDLLKGFVISIRLFLLAVYSSLNTKA